MNLLLTRRVWLIKVVALTGDQYQGMTLPVVFALKIISKSSNRLDLYLPK